MKDAKEWFVRIIFKASLLLFFAIVVIFIRNIINDIAYKKRIEKDCKIDMENFSTVTRSGHPGDTVKKDTIK